MSGQGDVDDRKEEIVRPRKALDPRPLYIGRMDLVIEGLLKDPWLSTLRWLDHTRCQNGFDISDDAESHFWKGKVHWAQLCGDGRKLHSMGVMDWMSSRIGLITPRFLDLR